MIKGWKKLTKQERKHLSEHGCNNLVLFKKTREHQKRLEAESESGLHACWDCEIIAKKLGLEGE